jgi:hypothetical protein
MLSQHQLAKVLAQPYTQRHLLSRFLCRPTVAARTLQSSYGHYMVASQFVPVYGFPVDVDSNAVAQTAWRRFSARECARLQGFAETWRLHPQRAYNLLGNAVPPPLVAMVAAPLLYCCGIMPHLNIDDSRNGTGSSSIAKCEAQTCWEWGWQVARQLLLDATPVDGRRRDALQELLSTVSYSQCRLTGSECPLGEPRV